MFSFLSISTVEIYLGSIENNVLIKNIGSEDRLDRVQILFSLINHVALRKLILCDLVSFFRKCGSWVLIVP